MTDISAVLVTRGDVDLSRILATLPFDDVVVYDNSKRPEDLSCYGRFAGIAEAKSELIYVQDDDLLVPVDELVRAYSGDGIVANKPPAEEWRFLGCGAIFPRDLVEMFPAYTDVHGSGPDFYRVADVVFAYLNSYRSVWLGYEDLPWQTADNRMYKQPGHYETRILARERCADLTSSRPDRQTLR